MSYEGLYATIPMGTEGLVTDVPQTIQRPTSLIRANCVSLKRGWIEKEPGSMRWNDVGLTSGIKGFFDWWPNTTTQRMIVAAADGKIYRFDTQKDPATEVTPSGTSTPTTLNVIDPVKMVAGGQEQSGNNRKLFIFTGKNPVQVIEGDASTRTNITTPAADWTGTNQPSSAVVHRSRLVAFGNPNRPHTLYFSDTENHSDFVTNIIFMNVYPGESERIVHAFVYKGKLFVLKFPRGLYLINDDNSDSDNWFPVKINDSFGGVSENCTTQALDDVLIANSYNSVTSLAASDQTGDVESADVFAALQNEQFVRDEMAQDFPGERHMIYYPDKKQVMATYRAKASNLQNRIVIGDLTLQSPRVSWDTKDQPNCLGLVKDLYGIERPMYGSDDGYLYNMDMETREVEGLVPPRSLITLARTGSSGALSNGKYRYLQTFYDPTTGNETSVGPVAKDISIQFTFIDGDVSILNDTITETDHGLANGTQVRLSSTGTLPAGLANFTTYYVVQRATSTFKLSLTSGGAAVDISAASGGGTHTLKTEVDQEIEIFDNTVNGRISLSSIQTDPNSTSGIQRRIYRTKVTDLTKFYLLTTIADNTTTTYADNTADASLNTAITPPEFNEFSDAYTSEAQIPHMDFAAAGQGVAEKQKSYDFLDIVYEASGDFDLNVDVFTDGVYRRTIPFRLRGRSDLDKVKLDVMTLDSEVPNSHRQPLNVSGKRISLKYYNNTIRQNYRLLSSTIYFRLLEERNTV